jgi:hypothetical protein
MGKFDKTEQQFAQEAFERRFLMESALSKVWSDVAREAAAEANEAKATHHLKEGFGAHIGQDFTRAAKDTPVTHIKDLPGGNAQVRMHEGRFAGQTAIVSKSGLKAI